MINEPFGAIAGLLATAGARDYLGEPVTVLAHLLQAAARAEAAGAAPAVVAAALLHDVGHLLEADGTAGLSGATLMAGRDNDHGERGAAWLASWFGPQVTEPVRLHIAAKRYLCGTEPAYYGLLSEASRYTLAVQGGPMTTQQARAFEALPGHRDAIAVRRWDDQAKDPVAAVPGLEHYRPLLASLAGERAQAAQAGTGEAEVTA
ncbi:MAG TPA: HD domain-containing protein [Trebonia sp.]